MTFTPINDTLSKKNFTILLLTTISDTLIDFEIHVRFTFTVVSDTLSDTFVTIILSAVISDTLIDFEIHDFVSEGLSAEMTRDRTW
jgi:hypothetical protein